jgi:diadenosine tetraphosphate (Ap4A) HIT family hydrolase
MSDSPSANCPFCQLPPGRILDGNPHAVTIADAFPVSPGHSLVISKRHCACLFELNPNEITAVYELLHRRKLHLDVTLKPAGYNVGVNIGKAAGQTVMHFHAHLIPRFLGDVTEPQGGIRSIIPGKGIYP